MRPAVPQSGTTGRTPLFVIRAGPCLKSRAAGRPCFQTSTALGLRETITRKVGPKTGGRGRIRTSVARKGRQVYSLLPLAARPPVHELHTTESRCVPEHLASTANSSQSFRIQTFHADKTKLLRLILRAGCLPDPGRGPDLFGQNRWSGRRESNPRPTAWKAVTLPLSYSRLQNKFWSR